MIDRGRGWLLLAALSLGGPAWAQGPADALTGVARDKFLSARQAEADGELRDAAARYRMVLGMEPGFRVVWVDLGRVLEALGDQEGAIEAYGMAEFDGDAVEALGRLHLAMGHPRLALVEFVKMRDLARGTARFLVLEARAQGQLDPIAAQEVLLEYLDSMGIDPIQEGAVQAVAEVAVSLIEVEEPVLAESLLDRFSAVLERMGALPAEGPEATMLAELRDQFEVEAAARELAAAANEPLAEPQRQRLVAARARGLEGRTELEALLREAPRNAELWATWGELREVSGDLTGAEQAFRTAERLAPLDPAHSARLGRLLVRHYGGRFMDEAADALARATRRGDPRPALWMERARAEVLAGRMAAAETSAGHYLQLSPTGPMAREAQQLIDGLGRTRHQLPIDVPDRGPPAGLGPDLWLRYNVARVRELWNREGDHAQAITVLEDLVQQAPDFVNAHNLLGSLHRQAGRVDEAIAAYTHSLERRPEQPRVLLLLADIHRQRGQHEQADAYTHQAAALGSPDAQLTLALQDLKAWRLWSARGRLREARSAPTPLASPTTADALQEEVEQRIRGVQLLGGLSVAVAVGLPLGLRRARRTGHTLSELLDTAHVAWPQVARIGSAIRHEVLKHNTTVLTAVADSLERGELEPAIWATERLFAPGGALQSFRRYVEDLELLGRVHGVRLNLRHLDPVFAPLIAAMDGLGKLEPALLRGDARIVPVLRSISTQLNQTGYRALGQLLQRVCLLAPDKQLFQELWSRVRAEHPEAGELAVELPEQSWLLRIFRRDLDDILVNLLRNAVEASPGAVGVRICFEVDDITGLERVAIRVRDRATTPISTAMIRGRYIDRGLGLAVDLISRNGGSIHVEDEPGDWSKAVVVRLPRAEAPELEEAL